MPKNVGPVVNKGMNNEHLFLQDIAKLVNLDIQTKLDAVNEEFELKFKQLVGA